MFWPLFRYASFVRTVYPGGTEIPFGQGGVSAHGVFLVALAVVSVIALCRWKRFDPLLFSRPTAVSLMMACTAVGALLSFGVRDAVLPTVLLWVSVLCSATGFLTMFLAWLGYFARTWGPAGLAVFGGSFFLGYVLSSHYGLLSLLLGDDVALVVMSLGSAVLWRMCALGAQSSGSLRDTRFMGWADLARGVTPFIAVTAGLLVVGSSVRGIVDLHQSSSGLRFFVSIALSAVLCGACLAHFCTARAASRVFGKESIGQRGRLSLAFASMRQLSLVAWTGLAVLLLVGLFLFLVMDDKIPGGDIVVVCRSCTEFLFLLVLCDRASGCRIAVVPFFIACGMSVEIVSWAMSYALVPALVGPTLRGEGLSANEVVLAVLFGVAVMGLLVAGARFCRGSGRLGEEPAVGFASAETAGLPMAGSDRLVDALVEGGLTPKEATVAVLYAQGYSLGKTAERLGMTKATAQSHIKGAYRKLAVHTKDELIERVGRLRGE